MKLLIKLTAKLKETILPNCWLLFIVGLVLLIFCPEVMQHMEVEFWL